MPKDTHKQTNRQTCPQTTHVPQDLQRPVHLCRGKHTKTNPASQKPPKSKQARWMKILGVTHPPCVLSMAVKQSTLEQQKKATQNNDDTTFVFL